VILATHGEQQVKAVPPEIDVDLAGTMLPLTSASATKNTCS
jgi:hypothetical protein